MGVPYTSAPRHSALLFALCPRTCLSSVLAWVYIGLIARSYAVDINIMQPPSDTERTVLRVIEEAGVIRGSALRRRARIQNPDDMVRAVQKLIEQRLIAVTGGVDDPNAAMDAYFSLVPSTRNLVKQAVEGR